MEVLGVDVGGSGMKGAIIDISTGTMVGERFRLATPSPATPVALGRTLARIVKHYAWTGPVGVGMPGPQKNGELVAMANLDKSWRGVHAGNLFTKAARLPVTVVNDADAAGSAEMRFGAGKGEKGVVLLVTLGTGIGSALFIDGTLVPNTEFGQMELRGRPAELRASARVRKERDLTWDQYARRLTEYFGAVENILWPDVIIVGGGVSRKASKFLPAVETRARLIPALLQNEAGIIGAALAAAGD